MLIARAKTLQSIQGALSRAPVTALYGPRQSGKTTLARQILDEGSPNYFDLEDPASLSRLEEPLTALQSLQGLVVIDEVQRRPDLFPILRVLADRRDNPARFLLLGSASGDLLRQSSESLAGRVERITISGFTLGELGIEQADSLWHRARQPRVAARIHPDVART
ncbi:MAG: AAA family ATPase [Chloroflexi bacterium]|nr:AAA family ATPase [Chloroflexota bacterium]